MGAIVAFGVAIFSRSLFLGHLPKFEDLRELYHPWVVWLSREWAEGRWLGWCHDLACGFPLWSNGQSGAFYPLTLLYLLPLRTSWMLMFVTFLHIVAAALGMFVLARRLTLGRLAATVAAIIFGFSGFAWAHHAHYVFAIAVGWMPWCALGMVAWTRRRAAWGLVVVAFALAFAAISHPQMPIFLTAFALAISWAAPRASAGEERVPSLLRGAGLALIPIVLAVMLAAIQLLPVLELVDAGAGGQRGGWRFMTAHSFPPTHFVTFLLPFFYGDGSGEYWASGNFEEVCGYIGAVALVLALLVTPRDSALRRLRGRLWLIAAIALLLALGRYTPLYRLVYYVPVLNRFRAPARWLCIWSGTLALVGGIAVQAILNGRWPRRARRKVAVAFVGLAVVCAVFAVEMVALPEVNSRALRLAAEMAGIDDHDEPEPGYRARRLQSFDEKQLRGAIPAGLTRVGLALAVAGALFLLSADGRIRDRSAAFAVAALIGWQVGFFAWAAFDTSPDRSRLCWPPEVVAEIDGARTEGRVIRRLTSSANTKHLSDNLNVVHEIPIVAIYDTMTPPVERLRWHLREQLTDPGTTAAFGAEIVLTDLAADEVPMELQLLRVVRLEPGEPPVRIYRNPRFRGLAWTDPEMPAKLGPPPPPAGSPREVRLLRRGEERIDLQVPAGPRCALVLAVANLPGWSATLNGREVPIEAANEVFMGIELPAEASTVTLRYRPAGFPRGLAVCVAGLLLMGAVVVVSRRWN